jgi:hypothetical protein
LISTIFSKIVLISRGAIPSEGSSSIRNFGLPMSARPIASICCSPPDSVPAVWFRRSFRRGKMLKT